MRICVPLANNDGMRSRVCRDYGDAPYLAIYDMGTNALAVLQNDHAGHHHCSCNPVKTLSGKGVRAVIAGTMDAGAILRLNGAGIKVYRARPGTLQAMVSAFADAKLAELCPKDAGRGHCSCQ